MKKVLLGILLTVVSCGTLLAYNNPGLEKTLDSIGEHMEKKFSQKEQLQRYSILEKVLKIQANKKYGKSKQDFLIVISWLNNQIRDIENEIKNNQVPNISYPKVEYPQNINIEKVQDARIAMHNDFRQKIGLAPFRKNEKLNYSAGVWANELIKVGTFTHQRKSTDGFYNYYSISDRFSSIGITFKGKGTLFSESIGYGAYSCSSADCTQYLINKIKKNFNFYMSEATEKGPHYRAIIHNYFNDIGMGIGITKGKYYIVTHYGRDTQ